MKRNVGKLLMMFVAIVTVSLSSCSKSENLIVGKWNPEKVTMTLTSETETQDIDVTKVCESVTFNEDETFSAIVHVSDLDENRNLIIQDSTFAVEGTWDVWEKEDILSVTIPEISYGFSFTIDNLDKNHLSMTPRVAFDAEPNIKITFGVDLKK